MDTVPCTDCAGEGMILLAFAFGGDVWDEVKCPTCKGTGQVPCPFDELNPVP